MNLDKILTKLDLDRLLKIINDKDTLQGLDKTSVDLMKNFLTRSKPIDPHKIRSNIVTMNSRICLKNIGNGKKMECSLVFPKDSDKMANKISVFSNLGLQILGSKVGTVIKGNTSDNQYYLIEDIIYQPEAAGDFHN